MKPDARRISVMESHCDACGTARIAVFHQAFPELQVAGASAERAARQLADRLTTGLNFVADPAHREPARMAIADVQAFLDREGTQRPARDV